MLEQAFDLSPIKEISDWYFLFYMAVAFILFCAAKYLNQWLAGYRIDGQIMTRHNLSIGVSFAGFIFALGLIISGVLTSPVSHSVGNLFDFENLPATLSATISDFFNTLVWATLGCLLLLVSRAINDRFLLPSFSNRTELIEHENIAVGILQAGSYIATALIIRATLGAEYTPGVFEEFLRIIIWFLISQILLLLYALIYQRITPFNVHQELKKKNTAVALSFAGDLVAYSILIKFYLLQYESLLGLFIWSLMASALLYLNRIIIDKLILPTRKLDDELKDSRNWSVACIEVAITISAALIIAGSAFN